MLLEIINCRKALVMEHLIFKGGHCSNVMFWVKPCLQPPLELLLVCMHAQFRFRLKTALCLKGAAVRGLLCQVTIK